MRFRLLIPIAVLSVLTLSLAWPTQDGPERHLERPRIDLTAEVATSPGNTPDSLLAASLAIDAYLAARHEEQLAGFYAGILEQQEVEREAARRADRSGTSSAHPGATVGDCTGFSIPDYIIARESGGNPSAYNPSGAYGCAQTLLSHYSGGSCAGLDPYTIDGQRECVWRLSNGGTNLAPWAQTR